ncbi:MAG: tandem-95 repeat protein [Chloroflexi bacterium]|nr:tandem-95 repeat protein [Chloroflexota bacterium]
MSRRILTVEEKRRRRHRALVYVILATLPFYFCGIVLLVGFSGRGGPAVGEATETPTETITTTPTWTPGGPTLTVAATLTLPATPTQMSTPTRTPTPNLDATATIRVLLTQGANSLTATAITSTEQARGTATAAVAGTQTAQAAATAPANAIASATADAAATAQANRPPIAENDSATTQEGQAIDINVLANDIDPNPGQTLTVTAVQRPTEQGGDVQCTANGICTYRPPQGFTGRDRFTYTVSDPLGATSTARVTVQVEPRPNTPPDAVNDEATTTRNTEVEINVLANDTDPDGDPLEVIDFDDETDEDGEVECTRSGICTYTPPDGFTGTDVFAYTISDGRGGVDTALVNITVTDG